MKATENLCANKHCDQPAPYGVICFACANHIKTLVNSFDKYDLEELHHIALRTAKPAGRTLRTTGNRVLQQDALNIVAWSLWHQLTTTWPALLPDLHAHPQARRHYSEISQGCARARTLIEGEPEHKPSKTHINDQMKKIKPMQPAQASTWLRENMNTRISADRIRKWHQRGQLQPRYSNDRGNFYHPADILKTLEKSRENDASSTA